MPQRLRIVETRVQLLRPSLKRLQKPAGAFSDFIHQPFRAKLIPFFPGVIAAAKKRARWRAFLSGSGSNNLRHYVATSRSDCCGNEARRPHHRYRVPIVTRADNRGAHVIRSQITDHHLPWAGGLKT